MIVYEFLSLSSIRAGDLVDINILIDDLSKTAPRAQWDALCEAVEHSRVLVARDDAVRRSDWSAKIVGMATLVPLYTINKLVGHIEDVIVVNDPAYRGQKIGKTLVQKLIEEARRLAQTYIDLTSNPKNPERARAIELYIKLGFVHKPTNVYRLIIK